MKRFLSVLVLMTTSLVSPLWAAQPRTLKCDFTGPNQDKVYQVMAAVGVGSTFRLPDGWKIADFVVTDPKSFHAESNGTIGVVTPLVPNKTTSVSIFTENEKLFVFSVSSEPSNYADQLVLIECDTLQFFSQKLKSEAQKLASQQIEKTEAHYQVIQEQKEKELKDKLLFSLNSNYEIRDRRFSIARVVDDKIFTYIQLGKSQERPVVYVGESDDPKKLEPVKYTDEGDYYVVHRVLSPSDHKRFLLKLGNDVSEIRPR